VRFAITTDELLDVPVPGDKNAAGAAVSAISSTAISSPNKTLTALMQLIACRLGMERSMVSVFDENAQVNNHTSYFASVLRWHDTVFSGRVYKDS
jgi:hypothetical protein